MAFSINTPYVVTQAISATETTQAVPLGTIVQATDPVYGNAEFIYLKGVASTAVGDFVIFDLYAGTTTRLVASGRGPCAVAMSANNSTSNYGWYQISGAVPGNVLASFANNANCYATATAGSIDDAVVSGDKIDGARSKTAIGTPTASQAVIMLARPSLNGNG